MAAASMEVQRTIEKKLMKIGQEDEENPNEVYVGQKNAVAQVQEHLRPFRVQVNRRMTKKPMFG